MKVVILAGGFGTRLSEETSLIPKPMLEIGGMPIIWHIMKMYSHHGFNDFVILLGYKGYVIKEYFSNYFLYQSDITFNLKSNKMQIHNNDSKPWKVTLLDTGLNTMTGGRLKKAAEYISDAPFHLTYGDGVADVDISAIVDFHQTHKKQVTVTAVQPSGRFGALDFGKDNLVKSFMEKPKVETPWVSGGFFVCDPKILSLINDDNTVFEQKPLIDLAQNGQLIARKHHGFWECMDTLRDKNHLNELWDNGKAHGKHGRLSLMILITGGLGYLGARIALHLISQGLTVRLGSSRIDPQIPAELINCQFVHTDFKNQDSLNRACYGVNTIIHLAGMSASHCNINPKEAMIMKGVGTKKLLLAAQLNLIKTFIYFSTVHVYGNPLVGDINENSFTMPSHPYSISHRLAEDLILEANEQLGIKCILFRLSNAVGSPVCVNTNCWSLVVNDLCKQVVINGEMKLNSNKNVLRDYLSINYICNVLEKILVNNSLRNAMAGSVINMSSGKSINLGDIVDLIKECAQDNLEFIPSASFLTLPIKGQKADTLNIHSRLESDFGIKFSSNLSVEISQLLLNCKIWFEKEDL